MNYVNYNSMSDLFSYVNKQIHVTLYSLLTYQIDRGWKAGIVIRKYHRKLEFVVCGGILLYKKVHRVRVIGIYITFNNFSAIS